MITFNLPLVNGQTILQIPGGNVGNLQMVLACKTYPSAGRFTIEYQLAGGTAWRQVADATADPFVSEVAFNVPGVVSSLRCTFANLAGGSDCTLSLTDAGNLSGISGVVTELAFFEQSSREGQVFEISSQATLVAGASRDTVVITGAKPTAIIARAVQFDGAKCELRIYSGPTYTGGTPATPFPLNRIDVKASLLQFLVAPTVTDVGIEVAAPKYLIGVPPSGNKAVQSQSIGGDPFRILAPNTTYLFRTTNTSADTTNFSGYSVWHEGDL
jgi:hypothetical protein